MLARIVEETTSFYPLKINKIKNFFGFKDFFLIYRNSSNKFHNRVRKSHY